MNVAPILVGGLTGNATNLILAQFNLGFVSVIIEPEPPSEPPIIPIYNSGGGYDVSTIPDKYKITFNIERKGMKWNKSYIVHRKQGLILIKISSVINTITNKINIAVTGIKKKIGNIGINIWKN